MPAEDENEIEAVREEAECVMIACRRLCVADSFGFMLPLFVLTVPLSVDSQQATLLPKYALQVTLTAVLIQMTVNMLLAARTMFTTLFSGNVGAETRKISPVPCSLDKRCPIHTPASPAKWEVFGAAAEPSDDPLCAIACYANGKGPLHRSIHHEWLFDNFISGTLVCALGQGPRAQTCLATSACG